MLPYSHHFVTPANIDIDLRLHDVDLQAMIKTIISSLLAENIPKNWFSTTKRRLINEHKREIYRPCQNCLNTRGGFLLLRYFDDKISWRLLI